MCTLCTVSQRLAQRHGPPSLSLTANISRTIYLNSKRPPLEETEQGIPLNDQKSGFQPAANPLR